MFHKFRLSLAVAVLASLMGITPASASSYTWISGGALAFPQAYHSRSSATHYLMNWQHTRKYHNIKNYPHTTWYATYSVILSHKNKHAEYVYVTNQRHQVGGWIWHGFLAPGTATKQAAPASDGLHLSSPVTYDQQNQFDRVVRTKLQDDGYVYSSPLAMIMDYYWSNDLTPQTLPLADAFKIEHPKGLQLSQLSATSLDKLPDIAHWIDPKNGNQQLEATGNGQLALSMATYVEQQLQAHHATQYALWSPLSGKLSQKTLNGHLILIMR